MDCAGSAEQKNTASLAFRFGFAALQHCRQQNPKMASSIAANISRAAETVAGKISSAVGTVAGQPTQSSTVLKNESGNGGLGPEAAVQQTFFGMQQERAKSFAGEPKQHETASRQHAMMFTPDCGESSYVGSGKMKGKRAVITGGDSGIGRAIAIAFAREGADVLIVYRSSKADADDVVKIISESTPQRCVAVQADVRSRDACKMIIDRCASEIGGPATTLVLNAAIQVSEGAKSGEVEGVKAMTAKGGVTSTHPAGSEDEGGLKDAGSALETACSHLEDVFSTNIWSNFYLAAEATKHFKPDMGCSILFITSVNAYKGHQDLLSYTSTKSAQVGLLRSLSKLYHGRLCRVNGIAPGPILTPLIPATWGSEKTVEFGSENPMGRAGQPVECACAAVFLCSSDSSYIDGQVVHVDGGMTTAS